MSTQTPADATSNALQSLYAQSPMPLTNLMAGYYLPHLLYLMARLRIADLLAKEPMSADKLAAATGTNPDVLARMLHALAGFGIFTEDESGNFGLSAVGQGLRTDAPNSEWEWVLLYGGLFREAWHGLEQSLLSGGPAFDSLFGADFYSYLDAHPEQAQLVNRGLTRTAFAELAGLPVAYDFSTAHTVVDLGGGYGAVLSMILQAHPQLQGILVERGEAVSGAKVTLAAAQVADRCRIQEGDIFTDLPKDGDVYLLCRAMLNWDDATCAAFLAHCARNLPAQATLLIVDAILPDGPLAAGSAVWDLFLLALFGAKARTGSDFLALVEQAGLTPVDFERLSPQFSLLVCRPPKP